MNFKVKNWKLDKKIITYENHKNYILSVYYISYDVMSILRKKIDILFESCTDILERKFLEVYILLTLNIRIFLSIVILNNL